VSYNGIWPLPAWRTRLPAKINGNQHFLLCAVGSNRIRNLQKIRRSIVETVVKTVGVWYAIGTRNPFPSPAPPSTAQAPPHASPVCPARWLPQFLCSAPACRSLLPQFPLVWLPILRHNLPMPSMNGKSLNAFKEGAYTALDNFTEAEVAEMNQIADRLKLIFDAAKQRQQDELNKYR